MPSISTPVALAIAAGVSAASAGAAGVESHQQGIAISHQDQQKARVAADQEKQKQIDMRQNLLKALGSQNAGTLGAVGTGKGSSFGANAGRQITQEQNDLLVSKANSSAQTSLLDQAGQAAVSAGNVAAAGDFAKAAFGAYGQ